MIDEAIRLVPVALALLVVLIAVPLAWYVTWVQWQLVDDDPEGRLARVVAVLFTCVAFVVTVFAITFSNNSMPVEDRVLNEWQTQTLTRSTLLVGTVLSLGTWLRWYRRKNGKHP